MNTENRDRDKNVRPEFRLLAGVLAVLFLLGACGMINWALHGYPDRWMEASMFMWACYGFAGVASTGDWFPANMGPKLRVLAGILSPVFLVATYSISKSPVPDGSSARVICALFTLFFSITFAGIATTGNLFFSRKKNRRPEA